MENDEHMPRISSAATDEELTRAIRQSNADAFKTLYYRYFEKLYSFLWRKTFSEDTAQELVQETFVRIWQNRHNLRPDKPLKSYLYRTATNLAIDHLRKKTVRQTYLVATPESEPALAPDDQFELRDRMQAAIASLPEPAQQVFVLSRFEGLKYDEIAELLQVSVKTIESRMSKALKALREQLLPLLALFLFWLLR